MMLILYCAPSYLKSIKKQLHFYSFQNELLRFINAISAKN